MSLLDRLRLASIMSQSSADPLFGGLIPRRVEQEPVIQERVINPNRMMPSPIVPRGAVNRIPPTVEPGLQFGGFRESEDPYLDKGRARSEALFDSYGQPQVTAKQIMGGRENNQFPTSLSDPNKIKMELDIRKQALDEWQAKNPKGEVKADENGELVIINPQSGAVTKTGVKTGDLSDKEKEKLRITNEKELIKARGDETRRTNEERPHYISPAQQRMAEDDAATELLKDPKYSWLAEKGVVTVGTDGVTIKRPTLSKFPGSASKTDIDNANKVIEEFEADRKLKAKERMLLTANGSVTDEDEVETEELLRPDGKTIIVPKNEVEDAIKAGAKRK